MKKQTHSADSHYPLAEEITNAITHGIGIVLGIIGLTVLMVFSIIHCGTKEILSYLIYGISFILLYTSSTLYHAIPYPKVKKILKKCDHICIYLFIAGSYTPFLVLHMQSRTSFYILLTVWITAACGTVFKLFYAGKWRFLSTFFYVLMGWLIMIDGKALYNTLDKTALFYLFLGGLTYTFGALLYLIKKIPFNHALWHLCVLAASVFHYIAIFLSAKWNSLLL